MNGHDEETYERKDEPTAFVPREEYDKLREALKELIPIAERYYHLHGHGCAFKIQAIIDNARKLTKKPNEKDRLV